MTILVPEEVHEAGLCYLKQKGYEIKQSAAIDEESLMAALTGCEAIIIRIAPVTRQMLRAHPQLRVIGKHGVGVDTVDLEAARERHVRVINTPDANTISVAEHAMGLMFALARVLVPSIEEYRAGNYQVRDQAPAVELTQKVLGLIGFGKTGSAFAQRAHGIGMRVIVHDPFLDSASLPDYVTCAGISEVLEQADVLSLHLPLNAQTKHKIGEKELSAMKPTAMLINCARGGVVDHPALVSALERGEIAGAGLDVTDPEPLAPDHPLFRMRNVIVTPHSAATSREALVKMSLDVCKGIDDVLSGRTPRHIIV